MNTYVIPKIILNAMAILVSVVPFVISGNFFDVAITLPLLEHFSTEKEILSGTLVIALALYVGALAQHLFSGRMIGFPHFVYLALTFYAFYDNTVAVQYLRAACIGVIAVETFILLLSFVMDPFKSRRPGTFAGVPQGYGITLGGSLYEWFIVSRIAIMLGSALFLYLIRERADLGYATLILGGGFAAMLICTPFWFWQQSRPRRGMPRS